MTISGEDLFNLFQSRRMLRKVNIILETCNAILANML
jgi:hypothetical protein